MISVSFFIVGAPSVFEMHSPALFGTSFLFASHNIKNWYYLLKGYPCANAHISQQSIASFCPAIDTSCLKNCLGLNRREINHKVAWADQSSEIYTLSVQQLQLVRIWTEGLKDHLLACQALCTICIIKQQPQHERITLFTKTQTWSEMLDQSMSCAVSK